MDIFAQNETYFSICTAFATIATAGAALWAIQSSRAAHKLSEEVFQSSQRSQRNKEVTTSAITALNSAYSALTNDQPEVPPRAVRVRWLMAARQIRNYDDLKDKIDLEEYKLMCQQHEDAIRFKFYTVLNVGNIAEKGYYQKTEPLHPGKEIPAEGDIGLEPRSLVAVYDFALRSERVDPIGSIDVFKLLEDGKILSGNIGLKQYLESSEEYLQCRQQRPSE